MKVTKTRILLALICVVGLGLRIYQLQTLPNSLSSDEAAFGYNAYSILKTGRDEFNQRFPLLFRSFDDHKNPVFVYLLVPFVAFLGLYESTIRLPSALFGTLSLILWYSLTKILFKDRRAALLATLIAAVTPWQIQYSRIALEVETAFFFSLSGVYLFLQALKRNWLYLFSALCFALSFWTYYANKLWVVLFGSVLVLYQLITTKKVSKWMAFVALIGVMTVLPYVKLYRNSSILLRQYGISVFADEEAHITQAKWRLSDSTNNYPLAKLLHNRKVTVIDQFINGYLQILSPAILFAPATFNHPPQMRLVYSWVLPLALIGLFYLCRKRAVFWLLISWLILGFIPGAITKFPPFDRRILITSFPLLTLSAYGIVSLVKQYKPHRLFSFVFLTGILCVLLFFSVSNYLDLYFIHGKTATLTLWGSGMKETVNTTQQIASKYSRILVSRELDQPLIFYLFYLQYPPAKYLKSGGTVSGGYLDERNSFANYQFRFIKPGIITSNTLYVWPVTQRQPCLTPLYTINLPDGSTFVHIGEAIADLSSCTQ